MKKITFLIMLLFSFFEVIAQDDFLKNLENTNPKSNQKIIIFYKSNCPYCEQMQYLLSQNDAFQNEIKENFNVSVLDISSEEGKKMAQLYSVKAVPTVVKYQSNLEGFTTLNGFGSTARLSKFLGLNLNNESTSNLNRDIASICGNAIIETGEQCDDGNTLSGDGCNSVCMFENPNCGNGVINAGEQCDDGNSINGDGCNQYCLTEGLTCGNGVVNAGEQCDDGNNINGDGCNFSCMIEGIICGNGNVQAGEQCDDANTINGDGCNSTCFVESGYSCVGSPSICNVLSLEENFNQFVSLKTYPNPFSNSINSVIYLNDNSDVEMSLLDCTGKVIKVVKKSNVTFGENEISMNVEEALQVGLYFVKVQVSNANGVFYETKKVIKE